MIAYQHSAETLAHFQRAREGFLRDLTGPKYATAPVEADRFETAETELAGLADRRRNAIAA